MAETVNPNTRTAPKRGRDRDTAAGDPNEQVRARLAALIAEKGASFSGVSALIDKNPAYIQQFIRRGTPRKLDEADRIVLAEFFGVSESELGAPDGAAVGHSSMGKARRAGGLLTVPRLAIGASAGPGALADEERRAGAIGFDEAWLRRLGAQAQNLSVIRVQGDSMAPALADGDDILVDRGQAALGEGIFVLRMDDMLLVKRLSPRPGGHIAVLSDNPLYPSHDQVDPGALTVIGRVIWVGRRL